MNILDRGMMLYRASVGVIVIIAISACGNGDDSLKTGKELLALKNNNAAIIQLKNAIQSQPNSAEARFLFGKALFDQGQTAQALLELRKAQELKYPDADLIPLLARVSLISEGPEKVIGEFGSIAPSRPEAVADLKTTLAMAFVRLGKVDQAASVLQEALAAAPNFNRAILMQARLLLNQDQNDRAIALVRSVIARDAFDVDAWMLQGDILRFRLKDAKAAIASYEKAIEIKPDFLPGHSALVEISIDSGDISGAQSHQKKLAMALPDQPQTRYYEAHIAYLKHQYDVAREIVEKLIRVAPDNVRLLILAGTLEMQMGSIEQAEQRITRARQLAPELPAARKQLARIYLRSGRLELIHGILSPLIQGNSPDPEALALEAESLLYLGDIKQAEALFVRASKINPSEPGVNTALALTHLARGQAEQAFGELQAVSGADPKSTMADMAIISARIKRKELDQAMKAIDGLEKKLPNDPRANFIRANVYLMRGDGGAAKASFERAIKIDATFFPAVAGLAAMYVAEDKANEALALFSQLTKANPKNVQARLATVEIRRRAKAPDSELLTLLTEAVRADPSDPAGHLSLISFHLARRSADQALTAAQAAVAAIPSNPELLDLLGQSQLMSKDSMQALTTFNKVVALLPKSPLPLLRLSDFYASQGKNAEALHQLRRALELAPGSVEIQGRLIRLALASKVPDQAIAQAKSMQRQNPESTAGFTYEGDIEAQLGHWPAAVGAYRVALKKSLAAESKVPEKLHSALLAAELPREADAMALSWSKDHPRDTAFFNYLGDRAMASKDLVLAERWYRETIKVAPRNVGALNNLSHLLAEQKKDGALDLAERGAAAAPENVAMLDTLAFVLAAEGKLDRAVEVQKRAVVLAPDLPLLSLNLAKLYIRLGSKQEAKAQLDALSKLGAKFAAQAEVSKLLSGL